ncbi:ABC transporter permease [Desulfosporosinus sp.]|uniref:ABC transporter permease n=1 Tax=Desulfosporosinus sp. TaxID=157907 RepID=UPI0025C316EB|nr:ABC transporter permease [Desulfosporosinus sp.]MBC2723090.1 ABC transporter permease [Desulfosporosinus sp.]MBC2726164.1 ABC transporter permease [Desulfosporosinus sp.]
MLKRWLKKDKHMIGTLAVGPIIATMLICFIASGLQVESIPLAIANLDDSSISRQIVSDFENHSGFDVTLYVDSEEELQNAVYEKKAVAGLLLPASYGKSVALGDGSRAMLLLNGTNTTNSGAAQGYAASIFMTLNAGIQVQALQSMGIPDQRISQMMGSFTVVERNLYDPRGSFMYNLIYMVLPYMIQMQFLCFFLLPLFWEERESGRLQLRGNNFMYFRILCMCILISVFTYIALLIGSLLFHIPFSWNFPLHFVLMVSYTFALCAATFVISLFTRGSAKLYIFELFTTVGVLIMLTSGMVWPNFVMPQGFSTLVRLLWPFAHVVMPFKALHLKNAGWAETLPAMGSCILFGLVWLAIGLAICAWRNKGKANTA